MILNKRSGQAIVEFILGFWIFLFGMAALIFLTQANLARLTALQTAQLGCELQAQTDLPKESIGDLLLNQIKQANLSPRWHWTVEVDPPFNAPAARFYNLVRTKIKIQIQGLPVLEEVVAVQRESYE